MGEDRTRVETKKIIYPQIYAYIHPEEPGDEGLVKIGYTEQEDCDVRIRQQHTTASIHRKVVWEKLWSHSARYSDRDEWFKDFQVHSYLTKYKRRDRIKGTEWFDYHGQFELPEEDFFDFLDGDYSGVGETLSYTLRAEQEEAVRRAFDYFNDHKDGKFLWNAKPRFGKTLSTYELVLRMKCERVLIVTNRPSIAASWYDDFDKFIRWQSDYTFISTASSLEGKQTESYENLISMQGGAEGPIIGFLSLQDLKGSLYFGGEYEKLKWVKDFDWDLLVVDECHEGVDTLKTVNTFNSIKRNNTLYLSGTPFKQLARDAFSDDQMYHWTYVDEQAAKAGWNQEDQRHNPYEQLPAINMFSYQMSDIIVDKVNKGADIDGENIDFAFDLNEFFKTDDKGKFIYHDEVWKWLNRITDINHEKYPFSTKELRDQLKHTLWIMGSVASSKAMEKMLKVHPVFEQYEVVQVAGDGKPIDDEDEDALDKDYLTKVRTAIENKDKTITLTVGRLTTGVTVPEWSAVLVLSNMKSAAKYMQSAFRAQNPYEFTGEDGKRYHKENAYVFDFSPERTLEMYDEFANGLDPSTAGDKGRTDKRSENVKALLNFFPVIAEDDSGKMKEIDTSEVFSIPRAIRAREVVSRGFMCNFLFKNLSALFRDERAKKALENAPKCKQGELRASRNYSEIDTEGIEINDDGNACIDSQKVISETKAKFGPSYYKEVEQDLWEKTYPRETSITNFLTDSAVTKFEPEREEKGISKTKLQRLAKEQFEPLHREITLINKNAETEWKIAQCEIEKRMKEEGCSRSEIKKEKDKEFKKIKAEQDRKTQKAVEDMHEGIVENLALEIEQTNANKEADKKTEDIRDHLRGFARAIPAFLMAFGNENTTLATFEQGISEKTFKEVSSLSKDDFAYLRAQGYFDEVVFDEAIEEFLSRKERLSNYFTDRSVEDIFDYIPPQETNQIFTPKVVVAQMLDLLEKENPGVFSDPDKTFADLYMKSGLYLTEIAKRLFVGLKDKIPDEEQRIKHIYEKQLYGFAPTEIIFNIARNFIFGFDDAADNLDKSHIVHLDLTPFAKGEKNFNTKLQELFGGTIMKFDYIVGNPPYQEDRANTRDDSIYHHFYNLAEQSGRAYCLISPARFLSEAGSIKAEWSQKMLNDEHLKILFYEQDSSNVFPNTDIRGGLSRFLEMKRESMKK